MKKLIALAAATVSLATLAAAQDTSSLNNIAIRGGIAFPTSTDFNGTFIAAGVDYDFGKSFFGASGSTYLSFDWLSKSTQGTRGNLFPILINQKFMLKSNTEEGQMPFYGFLGAGLAIIDVGPSSTVFAGRFGLGAQVNDNFFVESALVFTSRTKTTNIVGSHVGLYLGYRF